jgi:hypothetical protein
MMQQITHQNKRLTELQNGGPILAQLKARLDKQAPDLVGGLAADRQDSFMDGASGLSSSSLSDD